MPTRSSGSDLKIRRSQAILFAEFVKTHQEKPILPQNIEADGNQEFGFTRREVVIGAVGFGVSEFTWGSISTAAAQQPTTGTIDYLDRVPVSMRVNGQEVAETLDPGPRCWIFCAKQEVSLAQRKAATTASAGPVRFTSMAHASHLASHPSCNARKRLVETIESIAREGQLHAMQQAFIDHDAMQCGYCTPGQIMAAIACVREGHAASRAEIKEFMSGNLCRCGAYENIVSAIEDARTKMES